MRFVVHILDWGEVFTRQTCNIPVTELLNNGVAKTRPQACSSNSNGWLYHHHGRVYAGVSCALLMPALALDAAAFARRVGGLAAQCTASCMHARSCGSPRRTSHEPHKCPCHKLVRWRMWAHRSRRSGRDASQEDSTCDCSPRTRTMALATQGGAGEEDATATHEVQHEACPSAADIPTTAVRSRLIHALTPMCRRVACISRHSVHASRHIAIPRAAALARHVWGSPHLSPRGPTFHRNSHRMTHAGDPMPCPVVGASHS